VLSLGGHVKCYSVMMERYYQHININWKIKNWNKVSLSTVCEIKSAA